MRPTRLWFASTALASGLAASSCHGWVASTPTAQTPQPTRTARTAVPVQMSAEAPQPADLFASWGAAREQQQQQQQQQQQKQKKDKERQRSSDEASGDTWGVVGSFTKKRAPRLAQFGGVVWYDQGGVQSSVQRQDLDRWEASIAVRRQQAQESSASDVVRLSRLVEDEQLGSFVKGDEAQSSMGSTNRWATRPLKVNLDLLNYHAKVARMRKKYDEAQKLWLAAVEMDPFDGRAWLAMARHEMVVRKNPERAREIFHRALQANPGNPFLLQALGVLEEKQGDLTTARDLFNEATRSDPTHAASWIARGQLELKLRHVAEARLCFRKAVEANADSYYAWHCLGMLEQGLGNIDNARALFARAVDANPRNAASYQAWGVMEARLGNVDQAAGLFRRGLAASPSNTQVMQAWACAESQRGNLPKAVELFERAIDAKPTDGAVYQAYALFSKELGDIKGARKLFTLGIKADPKHLAIYTAWGTMEAQEGNLENARQVFQRGVWAAPRKPGVSRLWQTWACVEAESSNLKGAREYFKYALDAEASPPAITLVMWAEVEERLGDLERARSLLEDAVRAEPRNRRPWQILIEFERRQGRESDAARVEQRAEFTRILDESQFNDLQSFLNKNRAKSKRKLNFDYDDWERFV